MGVGGSGTSTLGLSYSNHNIFPINSGPRGANRRVSYGAQSNIATPPIFSAARALRNQPSSTSEEGDDVAAATAATPKTGIPSRLRPLSARIGAKSSAISSSRESTTGGKPAQVANGATRTQNKTPGMSRATASNYLNPHLRRRSRSGVFENQEPSSAMGGGATTSNTSTNTASGAATISGGTRVRMGMMRPGATADRPNLHRPAYVAQECDIDEEHTSTLASSAAAGVAGRAHRMMHQATRLTVDPERAREPYSATGRSARTPVTAGESGLSSSRRRFLQTPSDQDMNVYSSDQISSASDKETVGNTPPSTRSSEHHKRSSGMISGGSHRPLQARLETSSSAANMDVDRARGVPTNTTGRAAGRPSIGTTIGPKLPTWRTQQAVREGNPAPQRTPASYTGVAGTKLAARENNSQSLSRGKSSDESKDEGDARSQQTRLRPVRSRNMQPSAPAPVRGQNNTSSSASAIGIGGYNMGYQQPRNAPRAGAAASAIGSGAPSQMKGSNAPPQPHSLVGQVVRPQVASYHQRNR
ncbi:hypothetical protein GGF37_003035 [Kickxella alabastrina]|nr:hypothetical protein GGF37_003035 [Kickxella alabastrina]